MTKVEFLGSVLVLGVLATSGCDQSAPNSGQALSAAPKPQGRLTFKALNVGRQLDAGGTAPPITLFAPQDRIIASVLTADAAQNVPIEVKLISMANGKALATLGKSVTTGGDTSTNFEFPKPTIWPLGRFIVEARVNGQLWASQQIEVTNDLPPSPSEMK